MECKRIAIILWYLFKLSDRFRWVFCQLDTLRHCLPSSIRRTLKELPKSLDETYERVLRDIKKSNRDLAHRLLQCLVVAIRPLRVVELAEVLAVDFDDEEGMPKLDSRWQWEDHKQALLSSCSSLISLVRNDDYDFRGEASYDDSWVVQFSHFSVKEFLTSPRLTTPNRDISRFHIDLEASHTVMAQTCLSVLLQLDDWAKEDGVRNSSSLARYAAEHWVTHAQFQNVSPRVQNSMERLFDLGQPYFTAWLRLYDMDIDLYASPLCYFSDGQKLDAGPLYYAALCGFKGLVEKLIIKYPHLVNATGGYYQTPALAALARRHSELARILHQHGSSVDLRGWRRRSPLHSAAEQGDSEIVQVLLDWKLDVNARCDANVTPLHFASIYWAPNISETIRLLLEYGADPNARTSDGSTPLHLASSEKTNYLIFTHGEYAPAKYGVHITPLHAAYWDTRPYVVSLLLEHGADMNLENEHGRTPLYEAYSGRHLEVMRLLLSSGAAADIQFDDFGLLTHDASYMGESEAIRLLLQHNANINARSYQNYTPLHWASSVGHANVVQVLLDHGADINALSDFGTPLFRASVEGHLEVTRLLLGSGADMHIRAPCGKTPIQVSIQKGHAQLARLLLEHDMGKE